MGVAAVESVGVLAVVVAIGGVCVEGFSGVNDASGFIKAVVVVAAAACDGDSIKGIGNVDEAGFIAEIAIAVAIIAGVGVDRIDVESVGIVFVRAQGRRGASDVRSEDPSFCRSRAGVLYVEERRGGTVSAYVESA